MPMRMRLFGATRVTSMPSKVIDPPVAGSKPTTDFNRVVFPAPLLPTMLTHSPGRTDTSMSLTTETLP